MSYLSIVEMAGNPTLLSRCVAASADEGITDPLQWAQGHIWQLAASPGWAEAWDYARETATLDHNPDTGARPGVINDDMILSAVQALRAPEVEPPA